MALEDFIIKKYLKLPDDYLVGLGGQVENPWALSAAVYVKPLWNRLPFTTKLKAILKRQWQPSNEIVLEEAQKVFMHEIFGGEQDLGKQLYNLTAWHQSQKWNFSALTEFDNVRVKALHTLAVYTRMRFSEVSSAALPLRLFDKVPLICTLIYPMVVKTPIISVQYFLDIHAAHTFSEIRASNHPYSDDIISYLYEVLFILQKTALSLHNYVLSVAYTKEQKKDMSFLKFEIDAIQNADLIFSYLKASIEKTIVMLGLIHNIPGLDEKKTHKAKLQALSALPTKITQKPYWGFVWEFIKSENLDELNKYRSGLLHKRGISDLQPHNYMNKEFSLLPFEKMFTIMHEQYSKNTAVLIATLALLTDDLIERKPSPYSPDDIPVDFEFYKRALEKAEIIT